MHLAIFGLAISSSWGNGHAALWRGLVSALLADGHRVTFFERDVAWYAGNRDLFVLPDGGRLVLYAEWDEAAARDAIHDADAVIATSYCDDGPVALALAGEARHRPVRCFYDLDTPVTLARLDAGERVSYLPAGGLSDLDLVLSYTGGPALVALRDRLGARRALPLYGSVDPAMYRPGVLQPRYQAALSYLGTYAEDRQAMLEALFVDAARELPGEKFVIGGAQYPEGFPWTPNIHFVHHLPPAEHPAFYASSRLTLNVTRAAMARMGHCPSGRLFEAAACGVPIVSDWWEGLDEFFTPGEEMLIAHDTAGVLAALDLPPPELARIASAGRARVLRDHTAERRARELVGMLHGARAMAAA